MKRTDELVWTVAGLLGILAPLVTAQEAPFNVKREWRLDSGSTTIGYLADADYSRDRAPFQYMFLNEQRTSRNQVQASRLHPADRLWIYHAFEWADMQKHGQGDPDPAQYDLPVPADGDRALFPLFDADELSIDAGRLTASLADQALWWDATGFLPIEQGRDIRDKAEWAYEVVDKALGKRGESSWEFREAKDGVLKFFADAYGGKVGFSERLLPYADGPTLAHYARGYNCVIVNLRVAEGSKIEYGEQVPITRATADGDVDFIYKGELVRCRIQAVEPTEPLLSELSFGSIEFVPQNRGELTSYLQKPESRLFLDPFYTQTPVWILCPYRLRAGDLASTVFPPIPTPDMGAFAAEGTTGTSGAGQNTSSVVIPRLVDMCLPEQLTFVSRRTEKSRVWTNSLGKTTQAIYKGKERGPGYDYCLLQTAGGIAKVDSRSFSHEDRTYLAFLDGESGFGTVTLPGRVLYRIRQPEESVPIWLELRFVPNRLVAVIEKSERFQGQNTNRLAAMADVVSGDDPELIRVDFSRLKYEFHPSGLSSPKNGSIERSLVAIDKKFGPTGPKSKVAASARVVEHDGFPARHVSLPIDSEFAGGGYEASVVFAKVGLAEVRCFWKAFHQISEGSAARVIDPASRVFGLLHQVGGIPLDVVFKHESDPALSFQLRLEEIGLEDPGLEDFEIE